VVKFISSFLVVCRGLLAQAAKSAADVPSKAASAAYCRQNRNFTLNCNWRDVPTVEVSEPSLPKGKLPEPELNRAVPPCEKLVWLLNKVRIVNEIRQFNAKVKTGLGNPSAPSPRIA
jgi:hypothetical protein